jgi:methionine-rich copper-binding protein CopC
MRRLFVLTAASALVALTGTANAHPKLVSATPAANTTVARPARVELRFSEKLVAAFAKADLTMAAMPGMAAMKMPSTALLSADGHTLVITPKAKLVAGRYSVNWHVVSTDTHNATGNFAFAVK